MRARSWQSLRLHPGIQRFFMGASVPSTVPHFEDKNMLKWDWAGKHGDWGFPMSVDGNVYRSLELKELVRPLYESVYRPAPARLYLLTCALQCSSPFICLPVPCNVLHHNAVRIFSHLQLSSLPYYLTCNCLVILYLLNQDCCCYAKNISFVANKHLAAWISRVQQSKFVGIGYGLPPTARKVPNVPEVANSCWPAHQSSAD